MDSHWTLTLAVLIQKLRHAEKIRSTEQGLVHSYIKCSVLQGH